MTRSSLHVLAVISAIAVLPALAEPPRIHPFYLERLVAGEKALRAHDGVEAANQLRIAAFGLVDDPTRRSEALVWLTLAVNGLGRTTDTQEVLDRFVLLQRVSGGYERSRMPDDIRLPFEDLLIAHAGRTTLAAIPSLAAIGAPPPKPTTTTPRAALSTEAAPAAPQPLPTATVTAPAPQPAKPRGPDAAAVHAQATTLLRGGRTTDAIPLLESALAADPAQRRLRLLLLEALCLSSRWTAAAEEVRKLSPIDDSEPVALFYAAAALYETGRAAEARPLLDRALPRIARTPMVERYRERIVNATSAARTSPGAH